MTRAKTQRPLGRRACDNRIRRHRDPLEAFLCNPRPAGIASHLSWGISWSLSTGAAGGVSGATLCVWCVKPEHVKDASKLYLSDILTPDAWNRVTETCEAIARDCGWGRGTVGTTSGADVAHRGTTENILAEQRLEASIRAAEKAQDRLDRIKRGLDPDNAAPMFE